ncbi:hypothetical protein BCL76_11772 [Streptomyces sp. CG 926]|nr:hypothetical protein BCL76_11772 [Streptomyces sp. CG 926]
MSGCSPHPRGCSQQGALMVSTPGACSPHPRGCSHLAVAILICVILLPAPAGVFPAPGRDESVRGAAPRTRGGVPAYEWDAFCLGNCSPHPRGCSLNVHVGGVPGALLPAPAGVFPGPKRSRCPCRTAPRTRGGVPGPGTWSRGLPNCSPHPRGCSPCSPFSAQIPKLLPAPAGVFPTSALHWAVCRAAPRTRGGVPWMGTCRMYEKLCSPHPRGCSPPSSPKGEPRFMLPAPAGVFPACCG